MHHSDFDAHRKLEESFNGYAPLDDSEDHEEQSSLFSDILICLMVLVFLIVLFNLDKVFAWLK